MTKSIWPRRDELLYHVFRLPETLPDGWCFGGGKPVTMTMVDWFCPPPLAIMPTPSHEEIRVFLRQKEYFKAGGHFVVIRNDGDVFMLMGGEPDAT
jgi:hypothetical protein